MRKKKIVNKLTVYCGEF